MGEWASGRVGEGANERGSGWDGWPVFKKTDDTGGTDD